MILTTVLLLKSCVNNGNTNNTGSIANRESRATDWSNPEDVVKAWVESVVKNDLRMLLKSDLTYQVGAKVFGEGYVGETLSTLNRNHSSDKIIELQSDKIYPNSDIQVGIVIQNNAMTSKIVDTDVTSVKAVIQSTENPSSYNQTIWFILIRITSKLKNEDNFYTSSNVGDWVIVHNTDKPYRP